MRAGPLEPAVRDRRASWRRTPGACRAGGVGILAVGAALMLVAVLAVGAGAQEAGADSTVSAVPVVPAVTAQAGPTAPPPGDRSAAAPVDGPAPVNLWATGVNATGAVLMTPLFPGWGQLYADGGWRAALAFGAEMYFWSNLLSRDRQARRDHEFAATLPEGDASRSFAEDLAAEHHEQMKDFVWWSGGALLIIALDAYVGAHLFNFDRDAVPVPDRWDDVFGPVGSGPAVNVGSGPEVTVFQWRKGF